MIKSILKLQLPFTEKVFCLMRYLSAPFNEVEKMVPKKGNILDVGCGHGLFGLILEKNSKQRFILGIDPDAKKIDQANKVAKAYKHLSFRKISLGKLDCSKKFDCLILFDVDYLLDLNDKEKILKQAKKAITDDGNIIVKTVIKNRSLGYYLGYLQELIVVFLFKKTFTKKNFLNFLAVEEYRQIFRKNNFLIKEEKNLKTFFYHPHYVFLLKTNKNEN